MHLVRRPSYVVRLDFFAKGVKMEGFKSRFIEMNGNQLKIVALLAMTCDHVGKQLLPRFEILQILGRLAFPIFAYMIAEGCLHTKSKKKYLMSMVGLALVCQIAYFFAMGSLYQCVLVTFSLSISLIYLIDSARKKRTMAGYLMLFLGIMAVAIICIILPWVLIGTDFVIDYGMIGVLLPVGIYLGKSRKEKLVIMAVFLILLGMKMGGIQWYGLLAASFLVMYNGKRGKMKMKHLFYIYYPLHLLGIYLIGLVVF